MPGIMPRIMPTKTWVYSASFYKQDAGGSGRGGAPVGLAEQLLLDAFQVLRDAEECQRAVLRCRRNAARKGSCRELMQALDRGVRLCQRPCQRGTHCAQCNNLHTTKTVGTTDSGGWKRVSRMEKSYRRFC